MRHWILLVVGTVITRALPAQTASALKGAAETITSQDVARHVGVMADDSMMGRGTPSPGQEMTAQYVADQFKKVGLKPGGDNGTWIQRYPLPRDSARTAPNTVGLLEGSDPKLKNEYIVFTAHMDHLGARGKPGQTDTIYNGADDNASGVAGLLELAEAFSRPGARPRRSLIFLAVSGEEKGLLGSRYFVEHPPVPLEQLAANVNLDMIGRSQGDTVLVESGGSSYLGSIVTKIVAAHPELRLIAPLKSSPGGSDFMSFQKKGVPILDFHTGTWHPEYHRVTDSSEKINADTEARILQLVFHVIQEVANADQRPQ